MPSHYIYWKSVLILSFHLRLGLTSSLFPPRFLTKTLYVFILSTIRATWPAYLIHLELITRIIFWWALQILKLLVMQFSGVFLYVLSFRPKYIILSIQFSGTLRLWSSLHVTDQMSYPHTVTRHAYRLYGLNSVYLQSNLEDKLCRTEGGSYYLLTYSMVQGPFLRS